MDFGWFFMHFGLILKDIEWLLMHFGWIWDGFLDRCLMDFGWFLDGFLGWILVDFKQFLDGFSMVLDGFWHLTVSRMHVCILSPQLYISSISTRLICLYLPSVPRMHMCILSPELQSLHHIYQAHLPSISPAIYLQPIYQTHLPSISPGI